MIKKDLLALRTLRATPKMMAMAAADTKETRAYKCYGYTYTRKMYEYSLFLRCQTFRGGYLKIAVFIPEHMRNGDNLPKYEIFIHKDGEEYLTWERKEQKWRTAMADNLDFGGYYWHYGKVWINPEGKQTIKRYLGVDKPGLDGIVEWQRKIRQENIEKKYKRMTDPWDAELAQTPPLPPDWERWAAKEAVQEHFLLYDYSRAGTKEGFCTHCESIVPIQRPKHNKKVACPKCKRQVTMKSRGKLKYLHSKGYYTYLPQRTEDGFVVREFTVQNAYRADKQWEEIRYTSEIRRAFFDKSARPVSAYVYEVFRGRETRFCKTNVCNPSWGQNHCGAIFKPTLNVLLRNEMQRTGAREFLKVQKLADLEQYLVAWHRYPQIELLIKAGLHHLALECLNRNSLFSECCDYAGHGLAKKMALDDQRLKRLRAHNGGICFWRWLYYEKKNGKCIPDDVIIWFTENHIEPSSLKFIADKMSEQQIFNYLRRQMDLSGMKAGETLTTWKDYISMAKKNGIDVDDAIIYRASKLKQRHDELILQGMIKDMEKEATKVSKKFPHVEQILQEIQSIYAFEGKDYTIIVPGKIVDIMVEGRNLHHCVATSERYIDRIERRESYILFLRKAKAPTQSYYTLEIEPDGTVRQKRTLYDRQHPDVEDANKFLRQWQKAIAKRISEKDRELAKKSKELRLAGFAQMRRDQVRINTGDLRGRLLADVLMADLMENEEVKTA